MESADKNFNLIESLKKLSILGGPLICSYGNKQFSLQKLNQDKTKKACFICIRNSCKRRYWELLIVFSIFSKNKNRRNIWNFKIQFMF